MEKENILCPGEKIKELLEMYHYTKQDLADKLDMELKAANGILDGKISITEDIAIKLETIFNIDAIFFYNLELNYKNKLEKAKMLC